MLGFDTMNAVGSCIQKGAEVLAVKVTVAREIALAEGVTSICKAETKCKAKTGLDDTNFTEAKKMLRKLAEI